MMKVRIMALVLTLCIIFVAACALADELLATIRNRGIILVATEGMREPWAYRDEDDKLVGFDVEVAQAIAEKLGITAEFAEGEWDAIFDGIDTKRYDIAASGVEITAERAEKYDFSIPYGYIRTALIVKGDNEEIHSFEDLAGKRAAASIASPYMLLVESYGATIVGVDTFDQTLELVISGRAEATLNSEIYVYDYLDMHPLADIKIAALADEMSEVAIPVRKGEESASLLAAVNQAIAELREEGRLSEISMKYFGNDITVPPTETALNESTE